MRFSLFALATAASLSLVAAFPTRFSDDNFNNLVARSSPPPCAAGPSNVLENGTCCQACPDKFTRSAHTNSCTCYPPPSTPSCPSGQRYDASLSICICISFNGQGCSSNDFCNYPNVRDSKNFCHPVCPPPSSWNVEHRRCDPPTPPTPTCPSGQAVVNGSCQCPSGSPRDRDGVCCFSPKTVVAGRCVDQCVGGQIRNHENVCECPKPFIFNKGLQKCITCPHGSVATADGNCFTCPAPSTFKDGACSCPSGQKFSNNQCVCPADSVKDAAGGCCAWPKIVHDGKCVVDCAARGQFRNAKGECECPANSTFNESDRTCRKNPPPACPHPATPSSNGECVCPAGSGQSFVDGKCICPSSGVLDGQGKCCSFPNVVEGGKCVPFCVGGQVRAHDGSCQCPPPAVFNQMTQKCGVCPPGSITTGNGACVTKSCPGGQQPLANGECPPQCMADKHGRCCSAPNTLYDGACVPACAYGQTRGPYGCQCPTGTEWRSTRCEPTGPPTPPTHPSPPSPPTGLPKGARCVKSSECASLLCIQAGALFVSISTCF